MFQKLFITLRDATGFQLVCREYKKGLKAMFPFPSSEVPQVYRHKCDNDGAVRVELQLLSACHCDCQLRP